MEETHTYGYTPYHPRWLRRRVSTYWWLKKPAYLRFILREGSCMFVGWFTVYLLLLLGALLEGPLAYELFLAWSATPAVLIVNVVTLGFVVFHAITFFQASPQAMVVRLGRARVAPQAVLLGHYAGWVVVSAVVAFLLLGA
ncbi:MAG: fumarate reductase subunit C [Acidobacteria bacterium]|nr:fumarate reductase subunit C [Acidobacteriota bacterium]